MSCSSGARPRARITAAAIMPPGVISCPRTSHAPTPSIATWRPKRTTLANAEILPEASLAEVCKRASPATDSRQRCASAGSIPIAAIASALRTAASAAFSARAADPLASDSFRRVARSLSTAHPNSASAPPNPIQPSTGWTRNTTPRKTGAQGASKSGITAGPPR